MKKNICQYCITFFSVVFGTKFSFFLGKKYLVFVSYLINISFLTRLLRDMGSRVNFEAVAAAAAVHGMVVDSRIGNEMTEKCQLAF